MAKDYDELVTSDDLALNPLVMKVNKSDIEKMKQDPLYRKRIKKNKNLQKQITKIGESKMTTTVTFTSNSSEAISRQWHLMFHLDDSTWNSWEVSNIKTEGSNFSFTVVSYDEDQRMTEEYLKAYLVAGVTMKLAKSANKVSESDIVGSLVSTGLNVSDIADTLLGEVDLTEEEEPDDEDGESDTVDAIQSMLTKMLPLTKDLKMAKEDEAKAKAMLSQVMGMMKGSGESKKNQG